MVDSKTTYGILVRFKKKEQQKTWNKVKQAKKSKNKCSIYNISEEVFATDLKVEPHPKHPLGIIKQIY